MSGKKFYAGLLLITVLVISQVWMAGAQDSTPRSWLSSEIDQATAGQEFNVTVNVGGAVQVYGGSLQVLYDAQAFEVVLENEQAVTPGAFFGDAPSFPLKNSADAAAGTVDYALTLTQPAVPVDGDGVLGTVKFRALKDAPVTMTLVNASLVSPEFTEVDGRMVAQKINQVEAQIAEMTIGDAAPLQVVSQAPAVVEQAPAEVIVVAPPIPDTATASVSVSVASNQNQPAPMMQRQPNNRVFIAAGVFFFAGLVLLIMSVGMYSKMRVRFSFADNIQEYGL
jgi:hypothetical protein